MLISIIIIGNIFLILYIIPTYLLTDLICKYHVIFCINFSLVYEVIINSFKTQK